MKSKVGLADDQADILAIQEQAPLPVCPKWTRLSEEDQLSLMRKEVKFKKMVFSELPADFVLFKQYNISASKMYQNLLALHAVNPANQVDIYEVTDALASLPSCLL